MNASFSQRFLALFSWAEMKRVFLRSPLSVLSSFAFSTSLALIQVQNSRMMDPTDTLVPMHLLETFAFASFVGVILFTGLALLSESLKSPRILRFGVQLLGLIPLYFCVGLPIWRQDGGAQILFALTTLSAVLLLIAAPFAFSRTTSSDAFWRWMMHTLQAAVQGIASGILLTIGISLALNAIQSLFGVFIEGWIFAALLSFLMCGVSNWIFLSQLPAQALHSEDFSTQPLLFFAKVVALPILLIFELILLIYLLKIAVTGVWPSGAVALPVLVYSLVGYVVLFALYPLRKSLKSVGFASKWFPALVMLFMVVYFMGLLERTFAYGVTELRYLGLLLGAILTIWSVIWASAEWKRKQLRLELLPLAVSVIALLVTVGPWSVQDWTTRSQMNRLEKMMMEIGVLENGQVKALTEEQIQNTDSEAVMEFKDQIQYLYWRGWDSNTQTSRFSSQFKERFGQNSGVTLDEIFENYGLEGFSATDSDELVSLNMEAKDLIREIPLGATQSRSIFYDSPRYKNGVAVGEIIPNVFGISAERSLELSFDPKTRVLSGKMVQDDETVETLNFDLNNALALLPEKSSTETPEWEPILIPVEGEEARAWLQINSMFVQSKKTSADAEMNIEYINFAGQLYLRD